MQIKRTSALSKPLTANGSIGYVRVAVGSRFLVGQTVNLTSTGPSVTGLQVQSIKGNTFGDISLYLIDPATAAPFNATAYTVANAATVVAPEQTLWYLDGGEDDVDPKNVFTDIQMQAIMAAILPGAATLAANVAVTNFPASQPVSLLTCPLPTGAATEATLAAVAASLSTGVAVTGTVTANGPLTDTQLRASPVPVSGTVTTGGLTDTQLRASPVPVSGSVTTGGLTDTQLRASPVDITGTLTGVTNPLPLALDRSASGNITNTQTVELNTQGTGGCKLTVSGSWTGSLIVEQSVDGTNWTPYGIFPLPTSRGLPLSSAITSNGLYMFNGSGAQKVRVRGNTVTGGTAAIYMNAGSSPALVTANLIDDGVVVAATATPLLSGGTWTTGALDLLAFASVSVYLYSDVPSATNGVVAEWSSDGTNWTGPGGFTYTDTGLDEHVIVNRRARYFRLTYTNGGTGQTEFRVQLIGQKIAGMFNQVFMSEEVKSGDVGILSRSVITGQTTGGGGGYVNVKVNPSGALAVDATVGGPVTIADGGNVISVDDGGGSLTVDGPLTDAQLRNSAVTVTGPLSDTQLRASPVPVTGPLTDTQLRASPVSVTGSVVASQRDPRVATWVQHYSPRGDALVQAPIRLVGSGFFGAALDATFWGTTGTTGSGSTTVANTVATVSTGSSTPNSVAVLQSVRRARYVFTQPLRFRATVNTTDTGTANNVRRIGVGDGTNGLFFIINGAGAGNFGISYQKAGGAFTDVVTGLNGDLGSTYTWSAGAKSLEIIWSTTYAYFLVNDVLLHKLTYTTTPLIGDMSLPIRFTNTNSGGSTTDVGLQVWNAAVTRLGNADQRHVSRNITTNTTTTLKSGPGTLKRVIVGVSGANNTATIFDNTAGSGTIIATLSGAAVREVELDADFFNGLTVVTASGTAANYTFIFD